MILVMLVPFNKIEKKSNKMKMKNLSNIIFFLQCQDSTKVNNSHAKVYLFVI